MAKPSDGAIALKLRALLALTLLSLALVTGCKKQRPDDNTRIPDPSTDHPVYNHRFDGGETDPYFKPGDAPAEGGDKGGDKGKAAPAE
jgi:hypothetical protein